MYPDYICASNHVQRSADSNLEPYDLNFEQAQPGECGVFVLELMVRGTDGGSVSIVFGTEFECVIPAGPGQKAVAFKYAGNLHCREIRSLYEGSEWMDRHSSCTVENCAITLTENTEPFLFNERQWNHVAITVRIRHPREGLYCYEFSVYINDALAREDSRCAHRLPATYLPEIRNWEALDLEVKRFRVFHYDRG